MLVYPDTSVLVAYFYPRDTFTFPVVTAVRRDLPDFIYWPFLRFELRHNLRLLRDNPHGETGWRALRAAEKTSARLRWQGDLTANMILDLAEELSADKGLKNPCGSGDVIHVAAARRMDLISELDEFWTCDESQAKLARAVGLKTRLFK